MESRYSRRPDSPDHFARMLRKIWEEMRLEYCDAGAPFGPTNRASDLWILYGQFTTCN